MYEQLYFLKVGDEFYFDCQERIMPPCRVEAKGKDWIVIRHLAGPTYYDKWSDEWHEYVDVVND